ncbi:MAG: hypothetical protein KH366_01000 [Clostridiaceae bacterium]|nr:hypothetical protein [Clostridiaceae bacterium]
MKKAFLLIGTVAMMMGLSACAGSKPAQTEAAAPAVKAESTQAQETSGQDKPEAAGSEAAGSETDGKKWEWGDITLVVPFKAGGGADTVARLLGEHWGKELGCTFIIDNRDGANTEIGTTYYVKECKPDATNLYMGVQIYYSTCILLQDAAYQFDDVSVMNFIELDPCCICVTEDSPYQTWDELNEAVLANPGKFSIAATAGGDQMLMLGTLADSLGWDVKIINYDGATERMSALLGGHVDMCATTITGSVGQGVTQIVVSSDERSEQVPDCPTLREVIGDDSLTFMGSSRFIGVHSSVLEEYPERYQILLDSLEKIMQPGSDYMNAVAAAGRDNVTAWRGVETSQELQKGFFESCQEYQQYLTVEE